MGDLHPKKNDVNFALTILFCFLKQKLGESYLKNLVR